MMEIVGVLTGKLPFKNPSILNTSCNCRCNLLALEKEKDTNLWYFAMEAKCLKHVIKWMEWQLKNKAISMKGLKLDYKYDEYSDGTTKPVGERID